MDAPLSRQACCGKWSIHYERESGWYRFSEKRFSGLRFAQRR